MDDEYEISDPFTMGGSTGNYVIPSPYHTECEWCIVSVVALGTLATPASFALGSKNPAQPSLSSTGADSFGNKITSSPDNINALQSYVGALTAGAPMMTFSGIFMPLPSPAYVYLTTTTPASSELLVTIQFRRKLDRPIPNTPRPKPHTHSHVGSRRPSRTFMEGWNAQYPEEGVAYKHAVIPVPNDTEFNKSGVLRPTTTSHRGIKNSGR